MCYLSPGQLLDSTLPKKDMSLRASFLGEFFERILGDFREFCAGSLHSIGSILFDCCGTLKEKLCLLQAVLVSSFAIEIVSIIIVVLCVGG